MEVKYINHMGDDLQIVNAARVSFGKKSEWVYKCQKTGKEYNFGTRCDCYGWCSVRSGERQEVLSDRDAKLIRFLARGCTSGDWDKTLENFYDDPEYIAKWAKNMPTHWTPFGHTAITLHIKAPIFVARQLGKHQVGMVWNEVSRRYITDDPEFYRFPEYRMAAPNVKQGSSDLTVVPKGQRGRCPVCGDTFTAQSTRSVYCSSNCQAKGWRSTPEGWGSRKWSTLKQSAEKRGLEFSITKEDIPTPTHCCYLGVELVYDGTELTGQSASVDRSDNSKGYVPGNIQTISNQANTMKSVASEEDIVKFSKAALLRHGGFMVPQVDSLDLYHDEMKRLYRHLIDNEGMCAEQARGFMPQTLLTEWYWTGNLYSFANVYIQRTDSHAQKEVQEISHQIGEIIEPLFPVSWDALTKGV